MSMSKVSGGKPHLKVIWPKTKSIEVITLPEGRCFMNRELLLKGHPRAYDPKDTDPLRHVISCVKLLGSLEMDFLEKLRIFFSFPNPGRG